MNNADMPNAKISKNMIGADYQNPYQAPYASNDYSQNVAPPNVSGGGEPYVNPQSVVDEHFFNPTNPNDDAFSDMQAPNEISSASPIDQIMSDFKSAQERMF